MKYWLTLSQANPGKTMVRWTDHLDKTIAVDLGVKPQTKQNKQTGLCLKCILLIQFLTFISFICRTYTSCKTFKSVKLFIVLAAQQLKFHAQLSCVIYIISRPAFSNFRRQRNSAFRFNQINSNFIKNDIWSNTQYFWRLLHLPAGKAQTSLRFCTASPEPLLLVYIKYGSTKMFRPKCRSQAFLDTSGRLLCIMW